MNNLYINPDGAGAQSQAVLAYLRAHDGIQSSWHTESLKFLAEPELNRWNNGRERGYVISLRSGKYQKKIAIAFFEHRNSDSIHCVIFEPPSLLNPPTIQDIPESHPYYGSKYATDHSVGYGKANEMADWIQEYMENWWIVNNGI